jgi:hypothetical protein
VVAASNGFGFVLLEIWFVLVARIAMRRETKTRTPQNV